MGHDHTAVVTSKEALQLLGIRIGTLAWLEKLARVSSKPQRNGYSALELRRLTIALKEAVSEERTNGTHNGKQRGR